MQTTREFCEPFFYHPQGTGDGGSTSAMRASGAIAPLTKARPGPTG